MKIIQDLIPVDPLKRPAIKMDWNTITVHNTANPKSTAKNERGWLTNPSNKRQASWHYVIDQQDIIQAIPDNEIAYHAGDGRGNGNMRSLSIEICESGDFEKSVQLAVVFIAYKLNEKGLGISHVKQHKDWSGKNCPRLLIPRWTDFIVSIETELRRLKTPPKETVIDVVDHWAMKHWLSLKAKGITTSEQRFNDPITRGEVFALLDRIVK